MKGFPRCAAATLAVTALFVALCLGLMALPQGSPLAGALTAHALVAAAAAVKLALLLATAAWAFGARDRLEPGHPARRPWGLTAGGFLALFAGQVTLAPSQLASGTEPFPSPADVFFLGATILLAAAFLGFLRAYRASGLVPDGGGGRAVLVIAGAAVLVGVAVLRPIAAVPQPPLARAIALAYPLLDLAGIVPLALLLRLAHGMGGAVGRVWGFLLGGFVLFTVGDVLFAALGAASGPLDPLVHATYVASYGLCAVGARLQLQLARA